MIETPNHYLAHRIRCHECGVPTSSHASHCPHVEPVARCQVRVTLDPDDCGWRETEPVVLRGEYTGCEQTDQGYGFQYWRSDDLDTARDYRITLVSHNDEKGFVSAEKGFTGVKADVTTTDGRHETLYSMASVGQIRVITV